MTILVVTHDLASAFHIADRMAMLNQGHLVAVDTTERFRTNTHPLIRQFLDRRPDPLAGAEGFVTAYLRKFDHEH